MVELTVDALLNLVKNKVDWGFYNINSGIKLKLKFAE